MPRAPWSDVIGTLSEWHSRFRRFAAPIRAGATVDSLLDAPKRRHRGGGTARAWDGLPGVRLDRPGGLSLIITPIKISLTKKLRGGVFNSYPHRTPLPRASWLRHQVAFNQAFACQEQGMKLQPRTLLSAGLAGIAWTATQGLAAASNTRTR